MCVRKSIETFLPILLAAAIVLFIPVHLAKGVPSPTLPVEEPEPPTPEETLRNDARVRAILQAYGSLFDSVSFSDDDAVFSAGARAVHFQDGRMLGAGRLEDHARFESIFYSYPLHWLTEPPPLTEEPIYSTDFLEVLFGHTESEIRTHGRSITFLDHRMFVNSILVDPLRAIETELRATALTDPAVARWIERLDITYSFINREIAGTQSRSFHAFGLAVDLVPVSYDGKQMYWRWSRVFDREGWSRIPMSRRWTPPPRVVETFEKHGFVWGGKWSHFDNIHFEFRPEIILYNRMVNASGP